MRRRDRDRVPARRAPTLEPKRRLLVVCEGSETEPTYLRGFLSWCRNPCVELVVVEGAGVPKTIVETAIQRRASADKAAKVKRDSFLAYDEAWCVFDVDEHPHLHDAAQMARANKLDLAISNPCFELWLLLHFRENPGAHHRHDLQRRMKDHVPAYDKRTPFSAFEAGYPEAVSRARRLDDDAAGMAEPGRNPTTGVYRLTERIRSSS